MRKVNEHPFSLVQHHSKHLAEAVGKHLEPHMEPSVTFLLQAFVHPQFYMTRNPENYSHRFTVSDNLTVQSDTEDLNEPIFELFNRSIGASKG